MSNSDRLSFEEAMRELQLSEEELEQKAAAGEIASIKDGDSLYFKREVIEKYKQQSGATEPTVLISDEEINLLEEEEDVADIDFGIEIEEPVAEDLAAEGEKPRRVELPLDEGADLDLVSATEGAGESEGLASEETVLNLDGILEDDSESTTPVSAGEAGFLEAEPAARGGMGDDTLLDTDILDLGEGEDTDTFELDTAEDTLLEPAEEGTLLRGGGARVMQMKRKKSHAAWTAILVVTGMLLLLPFGVLLCQVYWQTVGEEEVMWGSQYIQVDMQGADEDKLLAVVDKLKEYKNVAVKKISQTDSGYELRAMGDVRAVPLPEIRQIVEGPAGKVRLREASNYKWIEEYNVFRDAVEAVADLFR